MTTPASLIRRAMVAALVLLACRMVLYPAHANPEGGTLSQGSATFSSSGSQLTVTASDRAVINWQSFNIGPGQTTSFIQPSSSSVLWNRINDPNPSQILGDLNANGYIVLQNPSGFYIGGQASISTGGLLITTAPTPAPDLSGSGAWRFDSPPPAARIINYGQISVGGGSPAFLIAHEIEQHGTISAPAGHIGLYSGQKILVSASPDGRGLSAEVTLPEGSVDNEGRLIADGGTIALQAQVVNQGNLIQANSIQGIIGAIRLIASDSVNLGASSVISARGGAQGTSAGGQVTIKSDSTFTDLNGSAINIAGGDQGGDGGQVEISASHMGSIQSQITGHAQAGFTGGSLTIDPFDITLDSSAVSSLNSQIGGGLSQVSLMADHDIQLTTVWTLADQSAAASLSLSAGHNITLNNGTGIRAGNNWSLNLTSGTALPGGTTPGSGNDGIYLNGNAFIQAMNGNITLSAANEVQVGWSGQNNGKGNANDGTGRIVTLAGGSINVTASFGDVNSGSGTAGFNYLRITPFYTAFNVNAFSGTISTVSSLSGISTAAGGNVTLTAAGDVTSFLPLGNPTFPASAPAGDPGTGAFGPQPGNVTINAGGSVYGHYVMVNGTGTITAGQNVGGTSKNVALSLVKGGWSLDAQNGDIYLQEARNPNGVFNATTALTGGLSPGNHLFDFDPAASLELTAGNGVYLTGQSPPRPAGDVPILLPPTLNVTAGSGGVNLLGSISLFPSPEGNLHITTRPGSGGAFTGMSGAQLIMSDSGQTHWFASNSGIPPFSPTDHGTVPAELNNTEPVTISIAGNIKDVRLQTTKRTEIIVGGDLINSTFSGQNLHASDVTSIDVAGKIFNPGSFNWVFLSDSIQNVPVANLPPNIANNWQTLLSLAVNPARIASVTIPAGTDPSHYADFVLQVLQFGDSLQSSFAYNSDSKKLTFIGSMTASVQTALTQPLNVIRYDSLGRPVVDANGHFVTDSITWAPASSISALFQASQGAPALSDAGGGLVVGGTGQFNIHADSISLGNSYGIISLGSGELLGRDYSYLGPLINSGAALNVTVENELSIPSSTIASLGGGAVKVASLNGAMDLGSQELIDFEGQIMRRNNLGLGIYTSGGGDVEVTALGDINVDSSRIGTFNGGNVRVRSEQGTVNAGSGGRVQIPINVFSPLVNIKRQPYEYVYANGIVAETLVDVSQVPGAAIIPGNIDVEAPKGDILAGLGGILQQALNGNLSTGPTITLSAGDATHIGNIDLGNSGVIGVTVNLKATGDVRGLVISKASATVDAGQSFSGTLLSGGSASLSAGGTVSGTIIGVGGVTASGVGGVSASILGQNVSVNGGAAQSTLGTTATASTTATAATSQTSNETTKTITTKPTTEDEDDKKKKKALPLIRRVKRVTVILPKSG